MRDENGLNKKATHYREVKEKRERKQGIEVEKWS